MAEQETSGTDYRLKESSTGGQTRGTAGTAYGYCNN